MMEMNLFMLVPLLSVCAETTKNILPSFGALLFEK